MSVPMITAYVGVQTPAVLQHNRDRDVVFRAVVKALQRRTID